MTRLALLLAQAPHPHPVAPPGSEKITTLLDWATWGGMIVCLFGMIAIGAALAIEHKNGGGGGLGGRVGQVAMGCILIGAAPGIVNVLV